MTNITGKENMYIQTDMNTKDILKMANAMDMEFLNIQMAANMRENLHTIIFTEKENIHM